MRDAQNIQIDEIIIHILEPRGQGLVLSDVGLSLDNNPTLTEYFVRHIQGSLRESSTKAARFCDINPNQPSGLCEGLLTGRLGLVEGSRNLAQSLFQILEKDRRISPADLAICLYEAGNYPNERFLAILKIDPSQVFRHVILQDEGGNRYVSFEVEPKAFTSERLQKGAFIKAIDPRNSDYDMLLLDRQTHGAHNDGIAIFFSQTFLDAEDAFDPREYSQRIYKCLVDAQNEVRYMISAEQEEDLEVRIRQAVTSPRLNIDAWLNQLPYSVEVIERIDQSIRDAIPDREFDLDLEFSERLIEKIKYRGDYNLKMQIPTAHYYQIVVSEDYIDNDPGRPPYHRIILETEVWRKV